MSPRPILKRSVSTEQHKRQVNTNNTNHGVHFPPSPALARTFSAYSAAAYDRSPIVVSPNSCALPERGCPGRTYLLEEQQSPAPRRISCARDYHPRALAFASSSSNYDPVPPLIPDLSSESDESDGVSGLPGELVSNQTFGPHGLAGPHNNGMYASKNNGANNMNGYYPCDDNNALAFLPYPPSSPNSAHFPPDMNDDQLHMHKPRRRRDRRHESSVDPDRIPHCTGGDPSLGFSTLSISPPSPTSVAPNYSPTHSPTRKKGVRRPVPMQLPPNASFGFGVSDDGCLGGF